MEQLLVTPDMSATIANLADQLKISKTDVLQQAISEYAEKVSKKKRLMSFAGMLSNAEADDLLQTIKNNRVDKNWDSLLNNNTKHFLCGSRI